MATRSSCWLLTITQAKCAFANTTRCMMLQKEKRFIKTHSAIKDDMMDA
jgi:hypothetical protein